MTHLSPHGLRGARAGFSLVELSCALSVLLVSSLAFSRALVAFESLARLDEEKARALEAARQVLEDLHDADFARALGLYAPAVASDAGAAAPETRPGAAFDVPGLARREGDEDGRVGEVVFPICAGELRENVDAPDLGMPQDLNGDGAIDDLDHAADYQLLPVLVRVRWAGPSGPGEVALRTVLAER